LGAILGSVATMEQPGLHRDYLFRFAMRRMGNRELADDLVQETMLAALQKKAMGGTVGKSGYHGRSTYRVWLAGILKHKLMDALRDRKRYVALTTEHDGEEIDIDPVSLNANLEDQVTHDPQDACELSQLLSQVNDGLDKLPVGVAEVFVAREIEGETTASISARAGLSEANIWVRVHRARKVLQTHLVACGAVHSAGGSRVRWAA
jgi:RNA polymerase sigma-70 factor, ECF subfamily